jgi:hypothetical protein
LAAHARSRVPVPVSCSVCLILRSPVTQQAPGCRRGSHDAPHRVGREQALAPAGIPRPHHPHSGPHPGAGGRWHCSGTSRSPGLPGSPGRTNRRHRLRSGRAPERRRRSPRGKAHKGQVSGLRVGWGFRAEHWSYRFGDRMRTQYVKSGFRKLAHHRGQVQV